MRGISRTVNEACVYNSSCPSYLLCINVLFQNTQSAEATSCYGNTDCPSLQIHSVQSIPPSPRSGATAIFVSRRPQCCSSEIARRHNTLGRTPLDEESARRRDLNLRTHNIYKRETSMPPAVFEPTSRRASCSRPTP